MSNLNGRTVSLMTCLHPLAASILLGISAQSMAADANTSQLGAIVVTAEKRNAELQDVPSSITAITSQDIADAELNTLVEVAQQTPNLTVMTWGGRRDTNVFVRGIGPGLFTPPTVGLYVDGVNMMNSGMFDLDMLDIASVEILRGPQGTLYGGNSLAGIINVTTRSPDAAPQAKLALKHDDHGRTQLQAAANDVLQDDTLFYSVAGNFVNDNGNVDNTFLGGKVDERDDKSLRGKLMWTPNEDFTATLALDAERFRGGSYAFEPLTTAQNNPESVAHNFRGRDDRDTKGISLNMEWMLETMTLTSITSWRDWENISSSDSDGTPTAVPFYHSYAEETHKQISQELRLNSNPDVAGNLNWIAGLYWYDAEDYTFGRNQMDFGFGTWTDLSTFDTDQSGYAIFGQVDYALTDAWMLTAGLRFDHEERSIDGTINAQSGTSGPVVGDKDFNEVLPKLVLSYTATDDTLVYGSVAKGYRAGGFDNIYPNLEDIDFDSEQSINYEVGLKTSMLDDRLQLNAAAFLIDLTDQQVQNFVGTLVVTENAGSSTSKGLELEARYIPAPDWLINGGVGYTQAEFDDYKNCSIGSCDGNKMPFAPEWTASLAVQNVHPLENGMDLFSRVSVQHVGDHYFEAANQFEQDAYNLVSMKVGLEAEGWQAYVWGKNLLDETYAKIAFDQGFGPMAESGETRSVGVTVNLLF